MAQPWAVIAGNTVSALVGISVVLLIREPLLAMPIAASVSILGLFALTNIYFIFVAAIEAMQSLMP